jgi:hypothetical protein
MPENLPAGIVLTSLQWFEECLRRGCTVFDFPPSRDPRNVKKLRPGSICLILARPRPGAPRSEWAFVGEFTVKDVKLVRGEEFRERYASRAVETEIPFPEPRESSWIIEFENLVKYERPVRLSECDDVRTSTSRRPMSEWVILGFTYIKPEDASRVVETIRRKAGDRHDELVKELLELGSWLGFVTKKEEWTSDRLYRIDVTWRDAEAHAPLKAFEVETSGSVDVALARLTHARHIWNCEQLWLIVSDEARAERARALVEPRVMGSFASIRGRLRVLSWSEIHDLYSKLKPYEELLKDLAKR